MKRNSPESHDVNKNYHVVYLVKEKYFTPDAPPLKKYAVQILGICKSEDDAYEFIFKSKKDYILEALDDEFVSSKAATRSIPPHKEVDDIRENIEFRLFAKIYLTWTFNTDTEVFSYKFNEKTEAKMQKSGQYIQKIFDLCMHIAPDQKCKIYLEKTTFMKDT